MQVNDAAWVVIKQCLGNDLSEVCKERPICTNRLDSCSFGDITNLRDVFNPQPCARSPAIDGGWRECAASTRSAWWRRHDGEDGESRVGRNGAERRDREATTAKKDQATTCDYALATPCGALQR